MAYIDKDPSKFNDFLNKEGLVEQLYKAISQGDNGNLVLIALEILKKTNQMPSVSRPSKSEEKAITLLKRADRMNDYYAKAFELINESLLYAPFNSASMAQTHLERCRLLYKIGAYEACLIEIEICLAKGIPYSDELSNWKEECHQLNSLKSKLTIKNEFVLNYFKFNLDKHPLVPCLSTAADIILKDGSPTIVAKKDISTGTVVAVEAAYVGQLNESNMFLACYYCHKMSLNLIPCDNCVQCLFCSASCKELCWLEYHSIECHIIHVFDEISDANVKTKFALATRAALKLKLSCSWEQFIAISANIGQNKMDEGTIKDIFDVNNKASILYYKDLNFKQGALYNGSFFVALLIHYIKDVPSFFPEDKEQKKEASGALGAVILDLFATYLLLEIVNCANNYTHNNITSEPAENFGFFPFTSKLRHSCDANLLVIGLSMKVALVAIKPINSGEELQISYIGHWYEVMYQEMRTSRLFTMAEIMCQCNVCKGQWDRRKNLRTANMNKLQKAAFKKWKTKFTLDSSKAEAMFKECCSCLNILSDLPHTDQHFKVFKGLRSILNLFQYADTGNETII